MVSPWGDSWGGSWAESWALPESALSGDPDLTEAIRTAIVNSDCALNLATYLGSPAVFTRLPTPGNAPYPLVTVLLASNPAADEDAVNDRRLLLSYAISVHGSNRSVPATQYRLVAQIAYCLRTLFHRQRNLTLDDWDVVDQRCVGPADQPSIGQIATRVVTLNVRIAQLVGA